MMDAERFGPVAVWRGLTPIHPVTLSASLSFLDEAGTVHRMHLPISSLIALNGALVEMIGAHASRMNSHSDNSSGSPHRSVSAPLPGENV